MKLSELLKKLQEIYDAEGDVKVKVWDIRRDIYAPLESVEPLVLPHTGETYVGIV